MQKVKTDFGYTKVSFAEKTAKVTNVFRSVANKYDLMNDIMSFGIHRLWKQQALQHCGLQNKHRVLDLAGGTGDLAKAIASVVGKEGLVVLADINASMLALGKEKLLNHGLIKSTCFLQTNAECLSLPSNYFDCVTMAFGLRNVTHKDLALQEIFRVLKPGGRVMILEFSHVQAEPLKQLYDLYSFNIIPLMGEYIANDRSSYQYLAESIRMHPDQAGLLSLLQQAGFEECSYVNLLHGICAIHKGFKF